jgi:transcription elongation factor GreA
MKMLRSTYLVLENQKQELETMLKYVLTELNIAREKGDLKENAEYSSAKSKKIEIEREINEITRKLLSSSIIDNLVLQDFITFGNTVILQNLNTQQEVIYTILGEEESDLSLGIISYDSILGKNLLGKKINDRFSFSTISGTKEFLVKAFFIK